MDVCPDPAEGLSLPRQKAKVAERNRRGKLYRARAGEIPFWKVSYGYRRVVDPDRGRSRIEILEPEAQVVREIFSAYVERGLSIRQIAFALRDRAIPSPSGKPQWGTSAIDRVLHNEAYIGTVYFNRHDGPRAQYAGARPGCASARARSGSRSRCRRSSTVRHFSVSPTSPTTTSS